MAITYTTPNFLILNFNKQTSLWKKLYDFIYFSYFAITF